MLGTHLAEMLSEKGMPFTGTDAELDITDERQVTAFAEAQPFSWIINCAAYNAVDNAEDEREAAFRLNGTALRYLAEAANRKNACLVHFSTDYVFDGRKTDGYTEDDPPEPLSQYGESKLEGEKNVIRFCERYFIFRVSWLYGPYGKNFVHTMLRLFRERDTISVVDDQFGSPTYTGELAGFIRDLLVAEDGRYGLYHFSGEGAASWYDFACEIYRVARKYGVLDEDVKIHPVDSTQYPQKAKRPNYSYMRKDRLVETFGFRTKDWRETLEKYMKTISGKIG